LQAFLAPLPATTDLGFPHAATGWPRLKSVVPLELLAVASRVPGVDLVRPVLVIADDVARGTGSEPIQMRGLELPRIAGLSVLPGDPQPLDQLRGTKPPATAQPKTVVPVPVIPETC
jgi:hypothetical protein